MDAEILIQTLEKDRRLIRNMMPDLWPKFAARVGEVTARFQEITTEQELSDLGEQVFHVCVEYDFIRQRLALADGRGPLVYRLPKPQPPAQRDLESVANRFIRFGESVAPQVKPKEQ